MTLIDVIDDTLARHKITVWYESEPVAPAGHVTAYADLRHRSITMRPVKTPQDAATALHEIGHLLDPLPEPRPADWPVPVAAIRTLRAEYRAWHIARLLAGSLWTQAHTDRQWAALYTYAPAHVWESMPDTFSKDCQGIAV